MSPRRNWDSPTPSPASECAPPPGTKGGEGTLHCKGRWDQVLSNYNEHLHGSYLTNSLFDNGFCWVWRSQLGLGPSHSTESVATNRNKGQLPIVTHLASSDAGGQSKGSSPSLRVHALTPTTPFIASFFPTYIPHYHLRWAKKFQQ